MWHTGRQTNSRSDKSRTGQFADYSQLADSNFFVYNHQKTTLCTLQPESKPKPNTIDYWKCSILPQITFIALIYFKFLITHFGELTSPRVDQSTTWLAASWFVGELSCYPQRHPTATHDRAVGVCLSHTGAQVKTKLNNPGAQVKTELNSPEFARDYCLLPLRTLGIQLTSKMTYCKQSNAGDAFSAYASRRQLQKLCKYKCVYLIAQNLFDCKHFHVYFRQL